MLFSLIPLVTVATRATIYCCNNLSVTHACNQLWLLATGHAADTSGNREARTRGWQCSAAFPSCLEFASSTRPPSRGCSAAALLKAMIIINNHMINEITDIIKQLEQRGKAIGRALSALRDVDGSGLVSGPQAAQTERGPAKRKGGMTPEGKERLRAALRRRWAAKKRGAQEG
jgi:hypothetical protein